MKTKSSNRTVYVITAVLSVLVMLLAAAGFTNVEAQKVDRIAADNNLIKHAEAAGELATSMGVANTVYPMTAQEAKADSNDELGRMAEALMQAVRGCEGRSNRDLRGFIDAVRKLTDKIKR